MELHEKVAKVRDVMAERGFFKNGVVEVLPGNSGWKYEESMYADSRYCTQGRVCLRGAQGVAFYKSPFYWEQDEVDEFLCEQAKKRGFHCHTGFNNHPSTTAADIDAFLHEAEIAAKELVA